MKRRQASTASDEKQHVGVHKIHPNLRASAATETEIEIQSYSPTVADWLKTVVAGFYARTEKKVVNG